MVFALLALSGKFSFGGGFEYQLIESAFESLTKPTIAVAYDLKPRNKLEFEWKSEEDFRAKFKNLSGFESKIGGKWGFSKGRWPLYYFQVNNWDEYRSQLRSSNSTLKSKLENGKVTVKTISGPIQVKSLGKLELSKTLKSHWFYDSCFVSVFASIAEEKELLTSLADALGAKFVELDHHYSLEFNPVSHRARTVSMFRYEARIESTPALRADYEYPATVYASLSDAQLNLIYKSIDGKLMLPLTGALVAAVRTRLDARYGKEGTNVESLGASTQAAYAWIKNNVDFGGPGWAVVDAMGRVTTRLSCKKPGSYFRF